MIPRIIHQTAPSNPGTWPEAWWRCQETVLRNMSGYKYMMWTDEDLEGLIRERYPWFLDTFLNYPSPIFRADAARYFILYEHGGIYLDMDMEVLDDFYDQLPSNKPSVVESPFPANEKTQNSLMASPPRHPFWNDVMREMMAVAVYFQSNVLDATGPRMLDRVLADHDGMVHVLPMKQFNPPPLDTLYNTHQWKQFPYRLYTRHRCTGSWRTSEELQTQMHLIP